MRVRRANNQTDPLTDVAHTTRNGECYRERGEYRECGDSRERREFGDEEGCSIEEEKSALYTSPFAPEVRDAIARTLPRNSPEPWWKCLFALARELKGIESLADVDPIDLSEIVVEWHRRAERVMTDEFCADDAVAEFICAWGRVRFPKGSSPFDLAVAQMEVTKVPDTAKRFSSPTTRRLVHLCRELQRASGDEPFYLSSEKAGQIVGCLPMTAWRLLKLIEASKLITVVKRGQGHVATRFRYIASEGGHEDG